MDQQTIVAEIERRATDINLSVGEVCQRANVHPTTFSRWKKTDRNPEPKGANMALLERLWGVLADEEARLAKIGKAAVEAQAA